MDEVEEKPQTSVINMSSKLLKKREFLGQKRDNLHKFKNMDKPFAHFNMKDFMAMERQQISCIKKPIIGPNCQAINSTIAFHRKKDSLIPVGWRHNKSGRAVKSPLMKRNARKFK